MQTNRLGPFRPPANAAATDPVFAVALVTDSPGVNRRERNALTHAKFAKCENALALTVKAADRLANLQMSVATANQGKLEMYRKEHAAFKAAAYRAGLCVELWREMDKIVGADGNIVY
jgi:hypothetical protein